MAKFAITYTDPETGHRKTVIKEFKGDEYLTAYEWAEDYTYTVADKDMDCTIVEISV